MDKLKRWIKWLNSHKTKLLGAAAAGVAYVQNNLAQAGHVLSPQLQVAILGAFGVAAFVIGLVNTFTTRDPPP
jgi:protein involved in ribonucleotide reduction